MQRMMKRTIAAVMLAGLVLAPGCSEKTETRPQPAAGRLKVAATILPLADIAKNVGGDRVEAFSLLPPGASPHTFEPTPEIVKRLQDARILFMVGHGLDGWAAQLAKDLPGLKTITVDDGIAFLKHQEIAAIGGHDDEDEAAGGDDPHYWLSAKNGQTISRNVARALAETDPEGAATYETNLNAYLEALDRTDRRIIALLQPKHGAKLVTHHHAWGYFAAAYGLSIVGSFEPSPGQNLTPKEMAELEKLIRENGIQTVFIEPQLSEQVAEPMAQDLKLRIRTLDPEGGFFNKGYAEMLEANAQVLAESL